MSKKLGTYCDSKPLSDTYELTMKKGTYKSATPTASPSYPHGSKVGKSILIEDDSEIGDTVGDSSEEEEGSLLFLDKLSDSESEDELCDSECDDELCDSECEDELSDSESDVDG
ncbi:hypothetical protein TSUD_163160 [Trifolium subterraneum]|uniref:Uncharacterized protein n=1 Tax=Trifolium subterraneum TaxID=3900 RepID=A0A2Z6N8S0_TRISU|nr:hypothetical protein TSUD_163160 [Trifolium subterraneum]